MAIVELKIWSEGKEVEGKERWNEDVDGKVE